ncbi:MAG TPA: family 16 glycoside hydrolase [Bryobacteraceae bacterium]|nr:family 16 glycoside hydrolase [Bryobacteraceae bacterium]
MQRPMLRGRLRLAAAVALGLAAVVAAQQGYRDTPILPGQKWHVHDPDRPHPAEITPGPTCGAAPSDAIVLFDGKDLSQWAQHGRGNQWSKIVPARWKVMNGYFEVAPGTGDLFTRQSFGDSQIHIEWSEPQNIQGSSQDRGNSGVYVASRYEIQVLDSYHQSTYADGQAGAIYGQGRRWPTPSASPANGTFTTLFMRRPGSTARKS